VYGNAPYLFLREHTWSPSRPEADTRSITTTHDTAGRGVSGCGEGVRGVPICYDRKECKAQKAGPLTFAKVISPRSIEIGFLIFLVPITAHAAGNRGDGAPGTLYTQRGGARATINVCIFQ